MNESAGDNGSMEDEDSIDEKLPRQGPGRRPKKERINLEESSDDSLSGSANNLKRVSAR